MPSKQSDKKADMFDLNRTDIPFVNESLSTDVTPAVKGKLGLK